MRATVPEFQVLIKNNTIASHFNYMYCLFGEWLKYRISLLEAINV